MAPPLPLFSLHLLPHFLNPLGLIILTLLFPHLIALEISASKGEHAFWYFCLLLLL